LPPLLRSRAADRLDVGPRARGVRSSDADLLPFPEAPRLDREPEVFEPLRELTERHQRLGLPIGPGWARIKADRAVAEADVLFLQIAAEIDVDRGADRPRLRDDSVGTFLAVHQEDRVREEIEDGKVVFHDDDVLLLRE